MSESFPVPSAAMVDLVESLSDKQRLAFESLRGGRSFAAAAEQAGVARMTVYRWVKSDPDFRAAYNAWRQELAESAQTRLLKLADKAVDCVEVALKSNDFTVAVAVLTKLGVMRKTRRGSIDREVLQMQQDLEQQREKFKAAIGLMRHLLTKAGLKPEEQMDFIRQHGVDPSGLPGYEPIPQLDDFEEQEEEGDGPDEEPTDEDPADEEQAAQNLQMPGEEDQKVADPLSRAG